MITNTNTLTWLLFVMAFLFGGFLSYRLTKWYYKGKIAKLTKQLSSSGVK